MSDRLDDKITAFVTELVDDPPPAPDIDLDAARRAAPVEPTVPRLRLRDVAVAVAAFVAVVAAVGVVALVQWSGDSEPLGPVTTLPPTTTSVLTTTTTVPAAPALLPPLATSELLTTGDLPSRLDWLVFDEATHDGDSIAGWGIFEHGVLAVRCHELVPADRVLDAWELEPGPRSNDRDEPWIPLDSVLLKAMYADTVVVGEALYSSAPMTVTEAFNMMKEVTVNCFDSGYTGGWGSGGNRGESGRLALPAIGDDSIAIKVTAPLSWSGARYDIFRLAIVRDGTRLLIVEEHETVMSPDDPPHVSDTEFTTIVQDAVKRLKP